MEQAPSLIMNPSSGTSTPRLDPAPAPANEKEKEGETSSLASTSTITPDTPPRDGDKVSEDHADERTRAAASDPATPKATAAEKTARERAFEYGLDRNNFETEVHQVMGTLNSWWGGVKKQSTSALWSLKADVDKAVSQAQADLEHLKTTNIEVVRKERGDDTTPTEMTQAAAEKDIKGKGKEKEVDPAADPSSTSPGSPPLSTANFFSRLSSSTTQLQNTLQTTIQSTIASAQSNPALKNPAQFRDQLAQNLHLNSAKENLQMSMKQAEKLAEEYMKKGDQLVKDAEKWMGEAVKVVPPEEQERRAAGMSWDGSDWYSFTTSVPARKDTKDEVLVEAGGRRSDRQVSGVVLAGSRKDALLRRLREDKDLLLVDPESEDETKERREEFRKWVEEKWEAAKTSERDQEEGHVGSIRMALVPEQLTDEQFWQRYLFHKHMIEAEEEKRKAVLKASQQGVEEDFSWDDEAESETASEAPAPAAASPTTTVKTPATPPLASDSTTPKTASSEKMPVQPSVAVPTSAAAGAKASSTSTSTSPRDSEESYDLVSDQKKSAAQTEDDDSDWE